MGLEFLNGRWIRDRSLGHAVQEACRGLLMTGRYAVGFLFLTVPPDSVDVNACWAPMTSLFSLLTSAPDPSISRAGESPTRMRLGWAPRRPSRWGSREPPLPRSPSRG